MIAEMFLCSINEFRMPFFCPSEELVLVFHGKQEKTRGVQPCVCKDHRQLPK